MTTESTKGTANRTALLIVVLLSSFFNPFMSAAVNIALPRIGNEFGMHASALSWVAMAFLLSSAIFLVPFGKMADMLGRKKLFLIGNIIFLLATLVCGLSISGHMLIVGRFLQGIGSAMIFSTGMAIMVSSFPPQERGKVIGLNVSAVYIGLSAAPLLGGLLTQSLGWRSLFYINAIAGFGIILTILIGIREEWAEKEKGRFDYLGSVVYTLAILSLMYGFSKLPDLLASLLTGMGVLGLIIFVMIELRAASPVLNISLFRDNKIFAFSNLAALINYAATFGITFVLSLYLQNVKGLSPRGAGMLLVTQPVVMAVIASLSGRLSDKIEPRILSSLGMSIIVVGLSLLIFLHADTSSYFIVTALIILGLGFGLFSSPNTNAVMSSVDKKYLGVASATIGTMRLTGQMFSMAIAAMSIHIFIGESTINASNIPLFMQSVRVIFIVFVILCIVGVFASLARGNQKIDRVAQ